MRDTQEVADAKERLRAAIRKGKRIEAELQALTAGAGPTAATAAVASTASSEAGGVATPSLELSPARPAVDASPGGRSSGTAAQGGDGGAAAVAAAQAEAEEGRRRAEALEAEAAQLREKLQVRRRFVSSLARHARCCAAAAPHVARPCSQILGGAFRHVGGHGAWCLGALRWRRAQFRL